MLKFIAKIAEKYAKATNTASVIFIGIHQPKMPSALIKKDYFQKSLSIKFDKLIRDLKKC